MTLVRLIRLGLVGCVVTAVAALLVLVQEEERPALPIDRPAPVPTPTLATAVSAATATPSPTATPLPSPTATATPRVHVIGPQDTYYSIARTYGVSVRSLRERHGEAILVVGEPLEVPEPEPTAMAVGEPAGSLNGVALTDIVVMPPAVQTHVRDIYAYGQLFERNTRSFAKLGDSTIGLPFFLAPFDGNNYDLGPYDSLAPVVEHFSGSFSRDSVTVQRGLHAWNLFDPLRADPARCGPSETPIACEFRLHNPMVVLIRLGSNDAGAEALYEESMRAIVEYCLDEGVIPVLSTRADRADGPDAPYNEVVRRLAAEYLVPLWEFDRAAAPLPGRGLGPDGVHLNHFLSNEYGDPVALERGDAVQNLTALYVLETISSVVNGSSHSP